MNAGTDTPETKIESVTGVYDPERAEVLSQVAAEFAGSVSVRILDPAQEEDASEFVDVIAEGEIKRGSKEVVEEYYNGEAKTTTLEPRTPGQIKREVVRPAREKGYKLVIIDRPEGDSLTEFWKKVRARDAEASEA